MIIGHNRADRVTLSLLMSSQLVRPIYRYVIKKRFEKKPHEKWQSIVIVIKSLSTNIFITFLDENE